MKSDYYSIDYNHVYFNFNWTWIRDKQIIHNANERGGILIIADIDGNILKMFGYERIQ